jgi:hypothetical protein
MDAARVADEDMSRLAEARREADDAAGRNHLSGRISTPA